MLFGPLDILQFAGMNGLILIYLLVYVALTVCFSTLTRTQYIAIGMGFGALILFGIISAIPGWGVYTPDLLIANAGLIGSGKAAENWEGLWISLGLIGLSTLGAWLVFRQQEI